MTDREAAYTAHIESLKARTKLLALRVIRLYAALPRTEAARVIGRQLQRSATFVGANYRAACRVQTGREFLNKLRMVCEESDETQYWIELLVDGGIMPTAKLQPLMDEATELTAIFTRAMQTARAKAKLTKRN